MLHVVGGEDSVRRLLRDLRGSGGVLLVLARQDFKGRYRSASLGLAWSVLMPLIQGAVLAFVFSRFVRIETEVAYAPFVMSGMVTWNFISSGVGAATGSIVETAALAGKVYFPRPLLPMMPIAASAPGFAISMVVVIGVGLVFGTGLPWTIVFLPFAMLLTAWVMFSIASITSLLHVYFRDIRYVVQASLMVLIYATPVIYPSDVAGDYAWLLRINPFSGPVEAVRASLFGLPDGAWISIVTSIVWAIALSVVGLLAFGRHDRRVADRL